MIYSLSCSFLRTIVKDLFVLFHVHVSVPSQIYMNNVYKCPWRPDGIRYSEIGVIDNCELTGVGSSYQTRTSERAISTHQTIFLALYRMHLDSLFDINICASITMVNNYFFSVVLRTTLAKTLVCNFILGVVSHLKD